MIPNGKRKEEKNLCKRWLHTISRQHFDYPGPGHIICSLNFIGGRKTYRNNVPIIVQKSKEKKEEVLRPTSKARNMPIILQKSVEQVEKLNLLMPTASPVENQELERVEEANVAEIEQSGTVKEKELRQRIAQLALEVRKLKETNEELSQKKSPTNADTKASSFFCACTEK